MAAPAPKVFHFATLAGSFAFWSYLDRHLWFFGDDWQFLVGRGLWYGPTNPRSIWYPHFEHWSTLPILLWRALYNVFHLSSYWPYLLPLLATTVVVMHLLWRVCMHNSVGPWVAAAAVAVVGFLGAGAEDLGWAFQVGFVGSVAFGLGAILLVDRPETAPNRAQLALTSLFLLAGLMCSTVGDAMLVAVAVVLFARQHARRAIAVLAGPTGAYVVWFAFVGRLGVTSGDHVHESTLTGLPEFVWTGLSSALGLSFNLEAAGGALLIGLGAWAVWQTQARGLLTERPALVGLGAGAFVFYLIVALGRDSGGEVGSTAPRYIYVGMALLMPVTAYALGSLAGPELGSGVANFAVVALFLATALGGAGQAMSWATARTTLVQGLRTEVLATARLLGHGGVVDVTGPKSTPIGYAPDLTAAVLQRLGRSGLLGDESLSPAEIDSARAAVATSLTSQAMFSGQFYLASASGVATSTSLTSITPTGACSTFAPRFGGLPARVTLRSETYERDASVWVQLTAPSPNVTDTFSVLLGRPYSATRTVPVSFYPPANGATYLDDNYPQAALSLEWATGMPLTLCGLGQTPHHDN